MKTTPSALRRPPWPWAASALMSLLFTACNPFDPPGGTPTATDLVGDYVPTGKTLKRLRSEGYPEREIKITLSENGLAFWNIPDCWLGRVESVANGEFDSGSGSWRIGRDYGTWLVVFTIDHVTADSAHPDAPSVINPRAFGPNRGALIVNPGPPYGLVLGIERGRRGYLEFRRK